jgi:hypothetical protein
LKKTKKKPKTEEEEKKDGEDLQNRVASSLSSMFVESKLEKIEAEIELAKTAWLMENHLKMDEEMYDELYRLESIYDTNISGRDIILRLDLDVPLTPYEPPV